MEGEPCWAVGSCPSADPVLSYLCSWDLRSEQSPCPSGRGAARPPHPWQGGVQQLENSLSCLSFVLKGSLKIFSFLECLWSPRDSKGLPRAVPGLSRVMPVGCATGHYIHGGTHRMCPGSSPLPLCSLSSLLASRRELNVEPLKVFLLQSIFCIRCNRDYNNSVHLLISEFRLLLVSNSHYTQVVINMSDVQLKSEGFFQHHCFFEV